MTTAPTDHHEAQLRKQIEETFSPRAGSATKKGGDRDLDENRQENLGEKLDEAIEESFPASDPVSVTVTR
ncbi:hypothetical protein [Prosthecomicrobium pneumaticum]|uniref:Uncharacterized protein n=1 Tax=Prosthecomicrobium pneumaticum TaxID=81895 RepID=A0A7W9L3C6_9HYPH|nr:hypothetical protein [Prosthecomicrobium pneumaticum]MBB5754359.1 hypothetical protein [Prosthecomicrobium pneumaticum]